MAKFRTAKSREELERGFYIFHTAVLSILTDAGPNGKTHGPPCSSHVEALIETMVRIFAEGL
jgi:hypothetical protein